MDSSKKVKEVLHKKGLSKSDAYLLILYLQEAPIALSEVRKIAVSMGVSKAKTENISAYLSRAKGKCRKVIDGWELTLDGKNHLFEKYHLGTQLAKTTVSNLRSTLNVITDVQIKQFVAEAVTCFENQCYRAAVVLSWVGAVRVIQNYVLNSEISAFNRAMIGKFKDTSPVHKIDAFNQIRESDFLVVLADCNIIDKNIKNELEQCLKLRNSCGHPNSFSLSESRVASHIESLMLNVFNKF